jgi:hypothetical protein
VPRTLYQPLGVEPTATRAEIDAGLTRRASQYRDLVRTGRHPDQRIIERIGKAHETQANPDTRAAYDRSLARAAPSTTGARASWPTPAQGAVQKRGAGFFVSARLGEERAWKPFWLMVVPPATLVACAVSPAGGPAVASLAALAPWLPIALLGVLALCVASTVLLWRRCAFNVDRQVLAHIGRALSILALAGIGLAIYAATTTSLLRVVP